MEPIKEFPQKLIPEHLSGAEVASMVEELYGKIPVSIGCHLVESNVVLTLAGLKPLTEFSIPYPSIESQEEIKHGFDQLNTMLVSRGIRFKVPRDPKGTVVVENLLGFERISGMTKFNWVPLFCRQAGFGGLIEWHRQLYGNLDKIKFEYDPDYYDLVGGVERGYPDQAILDLCDWVVKGKQGKLQDSEIPHTGIYKEAQPNYNFYPEHVNDPEIVDNIRRAGKILGDFYASEWHQRVSKDSHFLEERGDSDKKLIVLEEFEEG